MKIKEFIKILKEYDQESELKFEQDIDGQGTMREFELDISEEIPYSGNYLWVSLKEA